MSLPPSSNPIVLPHNRNPGGPGPPGTSGPPSGPAVGPTGIPYGHLPSFMPGLASLVEELDCRLLLVLRDGRHLVGIFRTFDQFSNLVFEDVFERRILHVEGTTYFTDIPLGLYIIRGENMVLLGKVPENDNHGSMKKVSLEEFEDLNSKEHRRDNRAEWDFDTDLVA
mmetsp:Transcript_9338/g.14492  ORF Transcript_9338/g.14492 Transcript_9338/m.14492 type:complete len:168 (-) Transcript_9338:574-1077(-)